MVAPILDTKLHIPRLRDQVLSREQLFARFDALLEPGRKVCLVAASAGFGKTTLVVTWLRRLSDWNIGWLSLDREHNDPTRFLSYLISLFEKHFPGELVDVRKGLDSGAAAADYILSQLLNWLAGIQTRMLIVLDDYHEINDPRIHDAVEYLVEQIPGTVRIILTSRIDPLLPLGRMRARGQLVEIRAEHLRFTAAETAVFLEQVMDVQVSAGIASALEDRTEGWAAGLQLAALSLRDIRDSAERERFVQVFAGSHRHVVDYLAEEVLDRQPPEVLEFLLQTSILERLCPALCDCVTQDDRSRGLLDYLDRANLFLIPLDSEHQWYRYHHLFSDLLRMRLRHERPNVLQELHRRAAGWFEAQGLVREAVQHALDGDDFERAANIMMTNIPEMVVRGEIETVTQWLNRLPPAVILARPRLCLERARLLSLQHQVTGVAELLDAAEQQLRADGQPENVNSSMLGNIVLLRAYLAHERHEFEASIDCSKQALAFYAADQYPERGACLLYLAHSLHFGGWTREAVPYFLDAMTLLQKARNTFSTMMAMGQLATIYELLGNLHQARAILDDAFEWADQHGVQRFTPTAVPHVRMANILREWNRLDEAEAHLRTALEIGRGGRPLVMMRASLFLAHVLMARGDLDGAESAIAQAQQITRHWETDIERAFAHCMQMRLLLRRGNVARVEQWLQQEKLSLPDPAQPLPNFIEQKLLVWARWLLAVNAFPEALEVLTALHHTARAAGRIGVLIEVLVLQALTNEGLHRHTEAMNALSEAIRRAAPQGYARVFLDEDQPILKLLAQLPRDHAHADYAHQLLGEYGDKRRALPYEGLYDAGDGLLLETLSERELQVLHLLSQGLSSNEVADQLVIAVETARKHIKNIYGKLDVHNKVEAVRRAQELHLL